MKAIDFPFYYYSMFGVKTFSNGWVRIKLEYTDPISKVHHFKVEVLRKCYSARIGALRFRVSSIPRQFKFKASK